MLLTTFTLASVEANERQAGGLQRRGRRREEEAEGRLLGRRGVHGAEGGGEVGGLDQRPTTNLNVSCGPNLERCDGNLRPYRGRGKYGR